MTIGKNEFRLALHQKLCETADLLLLYHNPCWMRGGACLRGNPNPCCVRTRFKRWNPEDRECYWLGEHGCTFPNIECKAWLCEAALQEAPQELLAGLKALEDIAKRYELTNER